MPAIASVETGYYRIPLDTPLSAATFGVVTGWELVTVRVRDSDGAEGVGWTYSHIANGAAAARILDDGVAPLVIGEDPNLIEKIWKKVWVNLYYAGRGGPTVLALSALDVALWDLKARRAKQPLWRYLGGYDGEVPVYSGGMDLDLDAKQIVAEVEGKLAKGYQAIKIKVGRDRLSEDVEKLAAVRKLIGDDFPLMADANMKWTADEAIRAARAFTQFNLFWLEEPVIPDDVAGNVRVLREGGLPIATGENIRTLWEFKQIIAAGGVSHPEPDVTNCGGVTVFMKVANLAEA